jgi:predicted RNA-binding protein (virulence factor B family)
MIEIGKIHALKVVKQVDFGFYLDGEDLGEILLPIRYAPPELAPDDVLEVFLYLDSDDRPIATTEVPNATVGECAHLKVIDQSKFGAFLDWGLSKDLLVPLKEQRVPMQTGKSYTVILYLDKTGRIAATARLSDHLAEEDTDKIFNLYQEVNLHIVSRSDMGFRAVVNGTHLGLIHNSDVYKMFNLGEKVVGYIKSITEAGRINLILQDPSPERRMDLRGDLSELIIKHLKGNEGHSNITDKSPPGMIYEAYNVSKSNYKKAIGQLYKDKRIRIEKDHIKLY